MESSKVYVEVVARFDKDGVMMPMAFVWEDGRKYEIDKVKSKERCASRKAGGTGIMYTVVVAGKECHLYFEFDKWFIINPSCEDGPKGCTVCNRNTFADFACYPGCGYFFF